MEVAAAKEVIRFYALYIFRYWLHAVHFSIILDIARLLLRPILASVFVCKLHESVLLRAKDPFDLLYIA
jgi:hypothetical protein